MRYDTALSTTPFLTHLFIQFFFSFIAQLFFVTTIFTVAESLTRKAFGNHPQLWRVWEPAAASSYQILGRTVGGYLMVSIHLAFAVGLYFLTTSLFGWWTPSEELFNPNILAHYWPWLSPLSSSLSAGFVEECLFRAVPLACAALIGKKYGKLGWWLMGTMILQAVIFGAAHANYPAFPAYARIVELIMPSFFFGGVYLVFGLLPSIIAHYVYDVVWFALPIFISSAPGAILNKSFIILGVAVPLIMVIYARLRVGAWHTLAASFYNKAWSPVPHIETVKHEPAPRQQHQLTKGTKRFILAAGIVGFAVWFLVSPKKDNAQRLNINRANAIAMAKQEVAQHGTPIDASWRTLSSIVLTNKSVADRMLEHRFIWQHDTDAYKKLMAHSFLQAPYWYIRFIKINGTIDERAEEYNVHIHDDGVIRTIHQLAESLPGAQLSQQQAREKAYETLEKKFNLPQKYLHEISAQAIKMPARQDWLFVFQNSQQQLPAQSQARVGVYVAGDIVTDASRFVYVPEQWQRDEQSGLSRLSTLTSICLFLMLIFIILGIRVMQQHLVLSKMFVLISFVVFLVFTVLAFINGWPTTIAHFSPILPWSHQLFSTIGFMCILAIIFTVMLTYIFSLIMSYRNHSGLAKTLSNQFLGLAIGFVVAAALIVVQRMVPSLEPLWADYEPLANYCPIFAIITKNLTGYLLSSSVIYIILIGLDYYVRMNKWYRILFVVVGLTLAAKLAIGSVASWLTIGLALGILLLAAYEYLLKYDLALTFVAVGAYSITQVAQQIIFNAIPAAPLGGIISCIFIGALASYFFKKL
jgi:hypothetical protein